MCVIIVKPTRKVASPSPEIFENAMDNNPHGFSIALKRPGTSWRIFKTMDRNAMLEWIQENGVYNKSSTWIFHARIKTHGEPSLKNCHCWHDKTTRTIFAHNGTLGITAEKGKTDSETFFRNIFVPIYRHEGMDAALKAARLVAQYDKMAIIMPTEKHQIALIGSWQKREGVYYSNLSPFQKKTTYYSGFSSSLLRNDSEWEFDDAYWMSKAQRNAKHVCLTNIKSVQPETPTVTSSSTPHPEVGRSSTLSSVMAPEPPWGK